MNKRLTKVIIFAILVSSSLMSCKDKKSHAFASRPTRTSAPKKNVDEVFKQKIVGTFMQVQDKEEAYLEAYFTFNADGTGVQELYVTEYDENGDELDPLEGSLDFDYTIKDGHLSLKIVEINANDDEMRALLEKAADMQVPMKIVELSTQRLVLLYPNNLKLTYVRKVEQ